MTATPRARARACDMLAILMAAPATARELADASGLGIQAVYDWLRDLRRAGVIYAAGVRAERPRAPVWAMQPRPRALRDDCRPIPAGQTVERRAA